jgi:hypothetical protein
MKYGIAEASIKCHTQRPNQEATEPRSGKSALLTLKAIMLIIFHLVALRMIPQLRPTCTNSNHTLAVYHGRTLTIDLLNTQCTATNQYSLYK